MSFNIVNILAVISCIVAIVLSYKMVKDIFTAKVHRENVVNKDNSEIEKSEYKKILDATYWLEHERQRNQGEHFEDESVYLNRAQAIRTSTAFFSLVND